MGTRNVDYKPPFPWERLGDVANYVEPFFGVWAIEQGRNPLMRICLAGYEGEHEMPADWSVEEWEAVGGYGLIADAENSTGRAKQRPRAIMV